MNRKNFAMPTDCDSAGKTKAVFSTESAPFRYFCASKKEQFLEHPFTI
jgi:hypothetical protein